MRSSLIRLVSSITLSAIITTAGASFSYADSPVFKVAYASEWAPISFGENEKVKGILPDLIEEIIAKRMNIKVLHQGFPWARAQKAVENGLVDAFITTATEQRLLYSTRSKTNILKVPFQAFTLKGSVAESKLSNGHNVANLGDYLYCDVLGNGWAKAFYNKRNIDYLVTSTLDNCLNMMVANRVDVIIHASPVAQMFIKKLAIDNKINMLPKIYPESPEFPLLLSKKSDFGTVFLQKFDALIKEMKKSGEFATLMKEVTERNLNF